MGTDLAGYDALCRSPGFLDGLWKMLSGTRWYLGSGGRRSFETEILEVRPLGRGELLRLVLTDGAGRWNVPLVSFTEIPSDVELTPPSDGFAVQGHVFMDAVLVGAARSALVDLNRIGHPSDVVKLASLEQSNTSMLVPGTAFVKLYRRLRDHPNRETVLLSALTSVSCDVVPELFYSESLGGQTSSVAIREVTEASDLWQVMSLSISEDELRLLCASLGFAVAELHRDLASALPRGTASVGDLFEASLRRSAQQLAELGQGANNNKQLHDEGHSLMKAIEDLDATKVSRGGLERGASLQVIHGDLHLAQVLKDARRLYFIDFEGEVLGAGGSAGDLSSVEYDLASILRSFHYLTENHPRADGPTHDQLSTWFLDGYRDGTGGSPECFDPALLWVLQIEKACYELKYEVLAGRRMEHIPLKHLREVLSSD